MNLVGRSFLKEVDFTKEEFQYLLDLATTLRDEKRDRSEALCLVGRNIALIFEKTSTRTRSAFEVAADDQGAHVSYLGPGETQLGKKESVRDTARVLGRMYDGIEFRGFAHQDVEDLAQYAGVPVWNGLTDRWHPTQMLADMLTMRDSSPKPLEEIVYCYIGDARNNTANSLLVTGALLGMETRICGPRPLWPAEDIVAIARSLAERSGARRASPTTSRKRCGALTSSTRMSGSPWESRQRRGQLGSRNCGRSRSPHESWRSPRTLRRSSCTVCRPCTTAIPNWARCCTTSSGFPRSR